MLIKTKKDISENEITDLAVFNARRKFIKTSLLTIGLGSFSNILNAEENLEKTPFESIKNYTNYYEFSYNKEDSTHLAQRLVVKPWTVEITGEVENKGTYYLEDILNKYPTQERVYRFRCVEGWSMVVPWLGFPLNEFIRFLKPTSKAQYVEFTSASQMASMPNIQSSAILHFPYKEGLRIDEAMHPLTLLATGVYGEVLPKQNGAPLRLIVPWKYGFKSSKAIVKIHFSENQPLTSWNEAAPQEYGFYANVNPEVSHPRWSQRTERVLGSSFFTPRRSTELFNGYGEQVAGLYSNMDLKRYF